MKELIERLEKATEGSRELDGEIAILQGWTHQKMKGDAKPYWRKPGETHYFMRADGPPRYTTSIDCALTLVPEGLFAEIDSRGFAWVGKAGMERRSERAATPALALCIASLKARTEAQQ